MSYSNSVNDSPIQSQLKAKRPNVPYSADDLSCIHNFNAIPGMIHPYSMIEVVPGQKLNIGAVVKVDLRNPLNRPLKSGMRVMIGYFYCRWSDCWEGWNNFITKGRSGNIDKVVPIFEDKIKVGDKTYHTLTPMSPANLMGIPSSHYNRRKPIDCMYPALDGDTEEVSGKQVDMTVRTSWSDKVAKSALPLVAYQKAVRTFFTNHNLTQKNKQWFPDNENHFILPYMLGSSECQKVNVLTYDPKPGAIKGEEFVYDCGSATTGKIPKSYSVPDNVNNSPADLSSDTSMIFLNAPRFRQWRGDRFTTALPFQNLIRGDEPTLSLGEGKIDWSSVVRNGTGQSGQNTVFVTGPKVSDSFLFESGSTSDHLLKALDKAVVNMQAKLSMTAFNQLAVLTAQKQRNALTDGDYNSIIEVNLGINPHQPLHEPLWVGSMVQDIYFSDVAQTSQTTDTSVQGTKTGDLSSMGSGYVGNWKAPDYGCVIGLFSVVPDTYYCGGIAKVWTKLHQTDQYFPLNNNLAPQEIFQRELYCCETEEDNAEPFGFEPRNQEFKHRPNRVAGLMELSHEVADFDASLILKRRFTEKQNLSNAFVTMSPDTVDWSIFSHPDEPCFDVQIGEKVDSVGPFPALAMPGDLGLKYN